METLANNLDTTNFTKALERLVFNYKEIKAEIVQIKILKNEEIISLIKTLTAKISGENKNFEKKQMEILRSLQSKFDVQARQIDIFRKLNQDSKEEKLKLFVSKNVEMFEKIQKISESFEKLSDDFMNQKFEKANFLQKAIENSNQIVSFQDIFIKKYSKVNVPVLETVLKSQELVKVLQSKIKMLETDRIVEILYQIKQIL